MKLGAVLNARFTWLRPARLKCPPFPHDSLSATATLPFLCRGLPRLASSSLLLLLLPLPGIPVLAASLPPALLLACSSAPPHRPKTSVEERGKRKQRKTEKGRSKKHARINKPVDGFSSWNVFSYFLLLLICLSNVRAVRVDNGLPPASGAEGMAPQRVYFVTYSTTIERHQTSNQ